MVPWRPCFGLERVWLAADRLWPPFWNELVVEGEGSPTPAALAAAVAAVAPRWPGARARLTGALRGARWVADGPLPRVRAAGEAATPCAPEAGPRVEGTHEPGRLVLRTHHAAFDGRAAGALAADLGRALRGEAATGAAFAGVAEPPSRRPPAPEPPEDAALPVAAPADPAAPPRWTRRTLPGAPRQLVARAAAALAAARGAPLRVSVPVDLRAAPGAVCANLSGLVRLDVAPDADVAALDEELRRRLASGEAADALARADALRAVPLWLLAVLGGQSARAGLARGRVRTSATVSNLGRQDASVWDHAGFTGARCYWVPPVNPGSPAFVTLTGHAGGVELCVGLAAGLGDDGRLEALADRLAAALTPPAAPPPG